MSPAAPRGARATAGRVARLTVTAVAAGVAVVLTVPLGAGAWPVAQVVAFRPVLAAALLACGVTLLAVPRLRRGLLATGLVLTLAGAAQAGVLVARSVPVAALHAPADDGDRLVVLTFNTLSVVPSDEIAALVTGQGARVVVLPETTATTARAVPAALPDPAAWQVLTVDSRHPRVPGTALLVHRSVGTYPRAQALPTVLGSLVAEPAGPGPTLVAAHPMAPAARSTMATWRAETATVVAACDRPGVVVAGDLNATLDHPALADLGPCADAARVAGAGARGTWPATAPGLLAAPIDHVLVDARAWRVVDARVLPATGGSDHRPLVVTLTARPGGA